MGNTIFTTKDNEINVEEIMEKIREKIRNQQIISKVELCHESSFGSHSYSGSLQSDLSYLNSNYDIRNVSYFISSHRPSFGKFLVKGRQMVHGEVRRYVDPVFYRQTEFNAGVLKILNRTTTKIPDLEIQVTEQKSEIEQIKQDFEKYKQNSIETVKKEILYDLLVSSGRGDVNQALSGANNFEMAPVFATSGSLKQKYSALLPYLEKCSRILMIGPGTDNLPEYLKEHSIECLRIDSDPDKVNDGSSDVPEVKPDEIIKYLKNFEDNSLDGIFINGSIEKSGSENLVRILSWCYKKITPGKYLIFEQGTPKKDPHPLMFLLMNLKFKEISMVFLSDFFRNSQLKPLYQDGLNGDENKLFENYDEYCYGMNILRHVPIDLAIVSTK